MSDDAQRESVGGPPPGWPSAVPMAPAAGEIGPGMTMAGDPEFRPSFPGVEPGAATKTAVPFGDMGLPGASHTLVEPAYNPAPLGFAAAPPAPFPMQPARAAKPSRVGMMVGIAAVATIAVGSISFILLRHKKSAADEDTPVALDLPKEKKKKPKASAAPPAPPPPAAEDPMADPPEEEPAATAAAPAPPPVADKPAAPPATKPPPPKPPTQTPPTTTTPPARPTTTSTGQKPPTPAPATSGLRKIPRLRP